MQDSFKCKFLGKVSDENLDFLNQNGYIHFESFLSQQMVDGIQALVDNSRQFAFNRSLKCINGIPVR